MAKEHLSGRDIWQDQSGAKAGAAERSFYEVMRDHLAGSTLSIRANPNEFRDLYVEVELTDAVREDIYTPPKPVTRHGIVPDYAIDNEAAGKSLYIEVKRQDGWVEGKKRSAGRGNAHERSCKYFTPGLLSILRERGQLYGAELPFWTVFLGDITRDPCRVRELTLWYGDHQQHFFMWRDRTDPAPLTAHFDQHFRDLLL